MLANLFERLKIKGRKWNFEQSDLRETTEAFINPARGWYQIYTFPADEEPDFEEQKWCLNREDTLALVLIDIGHFRAKNLDSQVLERICRILSFFAENRYDCIVRAVYDHEGRALVREPVDFAVVQAHLRQIGGVIALSAPSVFVFQGMLLGNWGEMHGSRFLDTRRMAELSKILSMQKGEQTFLAVRRPVYWRRLHEGQKEGALSCTDKMGLFDDGMFGSASHMGTFAEGGQEEKIWNEPWQREQELAFEQELCRLAPNGGEAVYHNGYIKRLTPKKVIADLRQMQITYLNRIHDTRVLDLWKEWKYPGTGIWAGKSVFDYVGAHLGYRFLIRKVDVHRAGKGNGEYCIEIEIENTGFAAFYQEGEIRLEYRDGNGKCCAEILESRMNGWRSGETRRLSCVAEVYNGELFLEARRKNDGALIRFANRSDVGGRTMLGRLSTEDGRNGMEKQETRPAAGSLACT